MKLRFTRTAARQLETVLAEIAPMSPCGARHVRIRLHAVLQLLELYPFAGQRTGRGTIRRIVVSPYPYIVTYRVGQGEVVIRTIRHAARRPLV